MTPLTRRRTFLMKWGLPYAIVLAVLLWSLYRESNKPEPDYIAAALVLVAACAILFFVIKRQSRQLPDEVLDGGTFLRVTFGSTTEDIPMSDIASIEAENLVRLTRIVLCLRKPSAFGDTIAFYPVQRRDPSGRNEVTVSLAGRIGTASV
jgi:predicted permease